MRIASKLILKAFLRLGVVFMLPGFAPAAEYYVAPGGSDSNSGSISAPFKTFKPAVTGAHAGDTIYVRGGTYNYGNVYAGSDCFILLDSDSGSGVSGQPITIRNYPGETPVLDLTDSRFGGEDYEQYAVRVYPPSAFWVIQGLEITKGGVNIGGGSASEQVHDITIRGNNIHDITCDGGENPGIVRIDRGDIGGPYNIFIQNNRLHGLYDRDQPGQWLNVDDGQHFGAVTAVSREVYLGAAGGGTGHIEISSNTIYNVPQTFFFKNAMAGPIEIHDNTLYDSGNLGSVAASNIHFIHNLVYGVSGGFWRFLDCETYCTSDPGISAIDGQNAVITDNTFVGLDSLVSTSYGTGHIIARNIIFGLSGLTTDANWDTGSYISNGQATSSDPAESLLNDIQSDYNCFISPSADIQMAAQYIPPEVTGTGSWVVTHYNHAQALTTFGFDPHSVFITQSNPGAIFVDAAANNYRLLNPAICPNMGYFASGTAAAPAAPAGLRLQ
jgi:hypothetical protein